MTDKEEQLDRIIKNIPNWNDIDEECKLWKGTNIKGKTPYIRVGKQSISISRIVYELLVGEIPKNYEVRHSCNNRWCMNPKHLELAKGYKEKSLETRFMEYVFVDNSSGCWLWTGSGNRYGYMSIKGKMLRSNRISYELFVGEIPKDAQVLHKCDNPKCVNPDHLFLGSIQDNMIDMTRKGRHVGRLDEETVKNIRELYESEKYSQYQLAEMFNISQTHVSQIIRKARWGWM